MSIQNMNQRLTRDFVTEAIKDVGKVVDLWDASDAPNTNWRGSTTKQISGDVLAALDAICSMCGATELDDDVKEIILEIDRLQSELAAWGIALDISADSVHPAGTPELWSSFRAVREIIRPRTRRLPEPIRDLMESGVNDDQICKIYGFIDSNGTPDPVKLFEEKTTPGTHFDVKKWVHPSEARRMAEINERWKNRTFTEHTPVSTEAERKRHVAAESVIDLLAQNVPSEQISLMKAITVEEVEAVAIENGLPIDGRNVRPRDETDENKQALANRRAELIPRSHPEISDMEERILACHIDDMKAKDIAEAMQPEYPDLSWQKVNGVIAKHAKINSENGQS